MSPSRNNLLGRCSSRRSPSKLVMCLSTAKRCSFWCTMNQANSVASRQYHLFGSNWWSTNREPELQFGTLYYTLKPLSCDYTFCYLLAWYCVNYIVRRKAETCCSAEHLDSLFHTSCGRALEAITARDSKLLSRVLPVCIQMAALLHRWSTSRRHPRLSSFNR